MVSEKLAVRTTELLENWQRKCRISQRAHYIVANRLVRRNRLIGVPAVLLSAALGSGLLGTAQIQLSVLWRMIAGSAGIAAAVLTSFQMSTSFFDLAERHRSTAARFDNLFREIQQFLALSSLSEDFTFQTIDRIRKELNSLSEQAPSLPPKLLEERSSSLGFNESHARRYEDSPFNTITS